MAIKKPTVLYFKPYWAMGWLDVGILKPFILLCLLPILWWQFLDGICSLCCCDGTFFRQKFYDSNHWRLAAIAIGCLLCMGLEAIFFNYLLHPHDNTFKCCRKCTQKSYLWWRFRASLPLICFLLFLIALPEAQSYYNGLSLLLLIGMFLLNNSFELYSHTGRRISDAYFKIVVLYLVLLLVILPSIFYPRAFACDCAKISSVKSNMHTFQTIVETYALTHKGQYPPDALHLQADSAPNVWKDFANPMSGLSGYSHSYHDIAYTPSKPYWDILGIRFFVMSSEQFPPRGLVIYERTSPTKYYIYGTNKEWDWIQNKGQRFYLTNG